MYIGIKDKYIEFTKKLNNLEVKKKIFLRFTIIEKDKEEKDF